MMLMVNSYVQSIDAERVKQKAQIQRMCQENAWLRDELAITQQRLHVSEQRCVVLDEEKSHLQFLSDLNTYEPQPDDTTEVYVVSIVTRPTAHRTLALPVAILELEHASRCGNLRDMSALEVSSFHGIALYKPTFTYLLTYLQLVRLQQNAFDYRRIKSLQNGLESTDE